MPLNPPRTSDELLYHDQDHPLADFTFDSALGWHQSPPPYRVLISLAKNLRPSDLGQGMLLAARLGWEIVGGKRWRHVQVLRAVAPAALRTEGTTADLITANEPTNFSAFLARAPIGPAAPAGTLAARRWRRTNRRRRTASPCRRLTGGWWSRSVAATGRKGCSGWWKAR